MGSSGPVPAAHAASSRQRPPPRTDRDGVGMRCEGAPRSMAGPMSSLAAASRRKYPCSRGASRASSCGVARAWASHSSSVSGAAGAARRPTSEAAPPAARADAPARRRAGGLARSALSATRAEARLHSAARRARRATARGGGRSRRPSAQHSASVAHEASSAHTGLARCQWRASRGAVSRRGTPAAAAVPPAGPASCSVATDVRGVAAAVADGAGPAGAPPAAGCVEGGGAFGWPPLRVNNKNAPPTARGSRFIATEAEGVVCGKHARVWQEW